VGVEGIDLHDEDAKVVLGKEVVIIPDSVGGGLVVSVLLLGVKAGLPLVALLGKRSAANEVRGHRVAGGWCFGCDWLSRRIGWSASLLSGHGGSRKGHERFAA
jgi:hypothetical protein